MKKLWVAALSAGSITLCLGVFSYPAFMYPAHTKEMARRSASLSAVILAGGAIKIYAVDNDDRLPLSANWMDATVSYTKDESPYIWHDGSDYDETRYGLAFNRLLSGKHLTTIENLSELPLVFSSNDSKRNASGTGELLRFSPYVVEEFWPFYKKRQFIAFVCFGDSSAKIIHADNQSLTWEPVLRAGNQR